MTLKTYSIDAPSYVHKTTNFSPAILKDAPRTPKHMATSVLLCLLMVLPIILSTFWHDTIPWHVQMAPYQNRLYVFSQTSQRIYLKFNKCIYLFCTRLPYENISNDKSRDAAHFFHCQILRACNSILHRVATYTLLDQAVKNKLTQSQKRSDELT